MVKCNSVRSLGLVAMCITVLSGLCFFMISRDSNQTVLVPMDIVPQHLPGSLNKPVVSDSDPPAGNHDNVDNDKRGLDPPPNVNSVLGSNSEIHHHDDQDKQKGDDYEEFDREMPVHDRGDSSDLTQQLMKQKMIGSVNFDLWWGYVGFNVDDLRIVKSFPNNPDERKISESLHVEFKGDDINDASGKYGHKMYGYLLPPENGEYKFQIKMTRLTAAISVELWVSYNSHPLDMRKLLYLDYDDQDRPVKRAYTFLDAEAKTMLTSSVHYFEFLMKAYEGFATVDILWMVPGSDSFVPIPSSSLAMAVNLDSDGRVLKGEALSILSGSLPSNMLQTHHRAYYVGNIIYPIKDLDVLPSCEFHAVYTSVHRVKAYSAVYRVKEAKVYPKDDTWFKNWKAADKGNIIIEKETADRVLDLYKKAFSKSKQYTGHVSQLINLEETLNGDAGTRFLLELMIEIENPRGIINTSEYVFLPKGEDTLCHTSNFQWMKSSDVHLIVSVKNLAFWIQHLMQNMEEIYQATQDDHFFLIVVDYESQDKDIEKLMGTSSFKNWKVIHNPGAFSRSGGLQAGIDSVDDTNSIVMTIDMHLTLPIGFVEAIRRHTIQGKMAYTPFFFRLNKGYTELNYNGFWETLTYGLFGMFKSDWVNFGGFNLRKYKDKWGGEDWDILDRSMAKGYEFFRIRVPGLVHYYHTKAGMWGGKAHD